MSSLGEGGVESSKSKQAPSCAMAIVGVVSILVLLTVAIYFVDRRIIHRNIEYRDFGEPPIDVSEPKQYATAAQIYHNPPYMPEQGTETLKLIAVRGRVLEVLRFHGVYGLELDAGNGRKLRTLFGNQPDYVPPVGSVVSLGCEHSGVDDHEPWQVWLGACRVFNMTGF